MTTWIGCDVNQEGKAALSSELFTQVAKCLNRTRVDLDQDPERNLMRVTAGRSISNIYVNANPDKTADPPALQDEVSFKVDTKVLYKVIQRTYFTTEKGETRPMLNSLNLRANGIKLNVAGADGFRLSIQETELAEATEHDLNVNIPNKTVVELARLLPAAEGSVTLAFGNHKSDNGDDREESENPEITHSLSTMRIPSETVKIHSRLTLGNFPNYTELVPSDMETRATVNRKDLSDTSP